MILSIGEQAELFLSVFLAGCAAGVLYDIIEAVRECFPHSRAAVCAGDIIYWAAVVILFFLFLLERNRAEIRLFDIFAFFFGMFLYGLTLGGFVKKALRTALGLIKAAVFLLTEIMLTPLRLLWILLSPQIIKIIGSAKVCSKKVLHLSGVYAKIKVTGLKDQLRLKERRKK